MVDFCSNVREFMAQDKQNVISIHCKGGKGRTGTMICVWLIDCGLFGDAEVGTGIYDMGCRLFQSSKWKFEFTGPNQILNLFLYSS
jgi:hypothetical protein